MTTTYLCRRCGYNSVMHQGRFAQQYDLAERPRTSYVMNLAECAATGGPKCEDADPPPEPGFQHEIVEPAPGQMYAGRADRQQQS